MGQVKSVTSKNLYHEYEKIQKDRQRIKNANISLIAFGILGTVALLTFGLALNYIGIDFHAMAMSTTLFYSGTIATLVLSILGMGISKGVQNSLKKHRRELEEHLRKNFDPMKPTDGLTNTQFQKISIYMNRSGYKAPHKPEMIKEGKQEI